MLQANLRCQWYAWCCAVLAWQGRACRKPLVADIPSPCANHSHFELQSLIFQSLSNYVGANYCPFIKPAFSHEFLSMKKKKLFMWNTRYILFLASFCHGPSSKRGRASSHQISMKWGCSLDTLLLLHSKLHWAAIYINIFTFEIISDMSKWDENNTSLVFLIFSDMMPK